MTTIGSNAFSGCKGFTTIAIPDKVTTLATGVFSDCTNLSSVTFPSNLRTIGKQAFARCSALTNSAIPESVTTIGELAFQGCTGFTTLTIPNNVVTIGGRAYMGCSGLTTINIGSSLYANMLKGTLVNYELPAFGGGFTNLAFHYDRMKFCIPYYGDVLEAGKAYLPIEAYGDDALSIKAVEDDSLEGDLNKDGTVNVTDVAILVNRILGK